MRAAQSSPSYAGFVPWRVIVLSIAAVGLSAAIAVMVTRFGWLGPTALVASVFVGAAVVVPRAVAFALLIALIVVEPNAFDITAPLSDALYRFPGTVQEALPLAVSPIEALAILTLASLFARRDSREQPDGGVCRGSRRPCRS